MRVLFSTNCYSKDAEYLFGGGFSYKYLLCNYPFAEKWMITNGVVGLIMDGSTIDRKQYGKKALNYFGLKNNCFVDKKTGIDGYIYSIDSLIELYLAKDFDYICHFCGDVELKNKANWITEGIKKIEQGYLGARPKLPIYFDSPEEERELIETDIFSDHVYLISTSLVKKIPEIFSPTKPSCSPPHPEYGGESFERKMTRYMKIAGKKLAIIQSAEEIPVTL